MQILDSVLFAVLAVTVMSVPLSVRLFFEAALPATVPNKNDRRQKHEQYRPEHRHVNAVKQGQTAKRTQTVPHGHEQKHSRHQIACRTVFFADHRAKHRQYQPQKHSRSLKKFRHNSLLGGYISLVRHSRTQRATLRSKGKRCRFLA